MDKKTQRAVTWLVIIVAAIALLKSQMASLQKFFAGVFAKGNGEALYNELNPTTGTTPINPTTPSQGVRVSYCRSIAETVYQELNKAWYENTNEEAIVTSLNSLNNGLEASTTAANYRDSYNGRSLKADLIKNLDYDIAPFSKGRYKDLKDYIKNNII